MRNEESFGRNEYDHDTDADESNEAPLKTLPQETAQTKRACQSQGRTLVLTAKDT